MRKGNTFFTIVLLTGLFLGAGLMIFNSSLFNEITGADQIENQINQPANQNTQSLQGKETVSGIVIAGTTTPYLEYTKAGYEQALKDKKIVVLNFYASWCPICRAEASEVKAAFDSLTNPDVVGFQVNYNDPETDADEKALAKEFGVTYQHTKVILKEGKEVFKETAQWNKEQFVTQITTSAN